MKIHTFRIKPGKDLIYEIKAYAKANNIKAGFIITCVAGFTSVTLRMAGAEPEKQDIRVFKGPLELTSLVGTISVDGCHLHVTVTDKEGKAYGGHLKNGSYVHPTAEIVIGEDDLKTYTREIDEETGFKELVVV